MGQSFEMEAQVLNPGAAVGEILTLEEPLSFWGGFDPISGTIVDRSHPQNGIALADRIVAMPGSRGSGGTPAGLAEAIRRKKGPLGLILARSDVNIAIGAMVAGTLYGLQIPVVSVGDDDFALVAKGRSAEIAEHRLIVVAG